MRLTRLCVIGEWSYLPPESFNGSTTQQLTPAGWTNQKCSYEFVAQNLNAQSSTFAFKSPLGCLNDPWQEAQGKLIGNNTIELTFKINGNDAVKRGTISADCSFCDMEDGGLWTRGPHPIDQSPHDWLRSATAWLMRAAQITFDDGTRHLTPGYPTHYNGQWMRDGYYGIANAWDLANEKTHEEYAASFEWMLSRARPDGILPQMCPPPNGVCDYGNSVCDDKVGAPGWQGCQDLDTAGFAIKFGYHIWANFYGGNLPGGNVSAAAAFYHRVRDPLLKSLHATATDPSGSGLLWSNTSGAGNSSRIGYGFQDAEIKTGAVLYSSVLAWNASRLFAEMAATHGDSALAEELQASAHRIKAGADAWLWDGRGELSRGAGGVFRASTAIGKSNVDVWGNAMAGAIGFANESQSRAIFDFISKHESDIFYEGQVREIPRWQQWEQARFVSGADGEYPDQTPEAKATARVYQNGGFWATPHHHMLPFLARYNRDMACRLLNATIASFRGHGIWEWVGPFYPAKSYGAPGYTASASNTYYASKQLKCWQ